MCVMCWRNCIKTKHQVFTTHRASVSEVIKPNSCKRLAQHFIIKIRINTTYTMQIVDKISKERIEINTVLWTFVKHNSGEEENRMDAQVKM